MKLIKPLLSNTGIDLFYFYIFNNFTLYFVKQDDDKHIIRYMNKNILNTSHVKWIVNSYVKEDRYVNSNVDIMVKSTPIPSKYLVYLKNYKPQSSYSTNT